MSDTVSNFKLKHPDYFKTYYQYNKDRFAERNKNRMSARKQFYCVNLDGVLYCFNCKKDIKIVKMTVDQLIKYPYEFVQE